MPCCNGGKGLTKDEKETSAHPNLTKDKIEIEKKGGFFLHLGA